MMQLNFRGPIKFTLFARTTLYSRCGIEIILQQLSISYRLYSSGSRKDIKEGLFSGGTFPGGFPKVGGADLRGFALPAVRVYFPQVFRVTIYL